ncbi:efflux RND transporter permease subunit, partial [Acinetobacter baumannii]
MLPVAVAPKTGIDAYSPLGTVVVGGLLIGTILSLFDIPIMHSYIDDLSILARKSWARRPGKGQHSPSDPGGEI